MKAEPVSPQLLPPWEQLAWRHEGKIGHGKMGLRGKTWHGLLIVQARATRHKATVQEECA